MIGAGINGHVSPRWAAAAARFILRDLDREHAGHGIRAIARNLAVNQLGKLTEADRDQTLEFIQGTTLLDKLYLADLIVEAVPELLDLKQTILRELESGPDRQFIFASNTSSLSITEIAKSSRYPDRVVGMHFFNPVHVMRLLEIVVGEQTSPQTVETARTVSRRLRKEPIVVKDVPGFASSRLGLVLGLEAMRMLEQGVASAQDIDKAMELGYNHPMVRLAHELFG